MKADLSRNTFDAAKRFSAVLMQQGRVQLDADWNEQGAIQLRYLRALAADVIGPAAGPAGNCAFALSPIPGFADFGIGSGRYYVDGILCEVDASLVAIARFDAARNATVVEVEAWSVDGVAFQRGQWLELVDRIDGRSGPLPVRIGGGERQALRLTLEGDLVQVLSGMRRPALRRFTTYLTQPDLPVQPAALGTYVAYLDVWERAITHLEDPSIRDVALGGPDTAARLKTIWQLKLAPTAEGAETAAQTVLNARRARNRGRLAVSTREVPAESGPPSPGGYRGEENRLYRIEVHGGNESGGHPTFKWSRRNGADAFAILRGGGTDTLVLAGLGGDHPGALAAGDWVEVEDDDAVLQNRRGALLQVRAVDDGSATVVLAGTPDRAIGAVAAKHPLLRRWGPRGVSPIRQGEWIELEDGISIEFGGGPDAAYCTGDYWLVPARVATADVEWPTETVDRGDGRLAGWPASLPPHGVTRHYAPLALIEVTGTATRVLHDYRKQFVPLSR